MLCNAQSLFYKLDELRVLVEATKPVFICVSETWFTPDIDSEIVQIRGYDCFRCDRQDDLVDQRRGGGCAVYASLSVRASTVSFSSHFIKPPGFDCIFIKFHYAELKMCHLVCTYVPPNLNCDSFSAIERYFCDCLGFFLNEYPETALFFCGDCNRYNFDFLINQFNLVNVVHVPTFGEATLDKFFCDEDFQASLTVEKGPPLGNAVHAHNTVMIHRNLTTDNNKVHLHKVL